MGLLDALLNMSTLAIVVFAAGIVLLVIEMFMPGFGAAGGTGIALLFAGVLLTAQTFTQGLVMSAILIVVVGVLLFFLLRSASHGRLSSKLVLRDATDAASGFSGTEDLNCLKGCRGTTVTVLRPSGSADIDGVRLDVVTRGEYIKAGVAVEVTRVEGNRIVVTEVKP